MSQKWIDWAKRAVVLAKKHSPKDHMTISALEEIIETGMEPYHTLKAAVNRLESLGG